MSATAESRPDARLSDYIPSRKTATFGGLPDVHFLLDGSLGFVWQMGVPTGEGIDDAEAALANAYSALLTQLPAEHVLTCYIGREHDVEPYLALYEQRPTDGPLLHALQREAIDRLRHAQETGFFPDEPEINFFPRRQAIYLCLKSPPQAELSGNSLRTFLGSLRRGPSNAIADELEEVGHRFRRAVQAIEQTAAGNGLALRRQPRDEFVAFVASLLFGPGAATQAMSVGDDESVAEAIGLLGDVENINGRSIQTRARGERVWHRAVSMMWQPTDPLPGMLGDVVNSEGDIWVCVSFRAKSQSMESLAVKTARHMTDKLTVPWNRVEMAQRAEKLDEIEQRMIRGEVKGAVRLMVWVRGRSEEDCADRAARVASRLEKRMHAEVEEHVGSSALFQSLPLSHSIVDERALCRTRGMMARDAAAMVPLAGYWEGTDPQHSIARYITRWFTPLHFDPRDCDTNPHVLVFGGSGSGKTFFVQDLVLQLLSVIGLRVSLISIKPDYERLAQLFGNYVLVDLDGACAINPFRGKPTMDNLSQWLAVVKMMLTEGDRRVLVDKDAEALLSDCLMRAGQLNWDAHHDLEIRETLLSDVGKQLEQTSLGRDLYRRLQPYHSGPYSRLLNRPSSVKADDRFVFWNLSKVVSYPCAGTVLLCVFNYVNSQMYAPALLQFLKVVILDEGWAFMNDEDSSLLATKGFRGYRSLNGLAVAISQLLSDLDTPIGKAILANTANKIVLAQTHDAAAALPKYLSLSNKEREMIGSLRMVKGRFSEFMLKMEARPSTIGRLIPAPLRYAIATTEPNETARYHEIVRANGGNALQAVQRFAAEHPFGRGLRNLA